MASLRWSPTRNRWYIDYRDSTGMVRHKSTGCKENERSKADNMLAEFKDEQRLDRIDPFAKHRKTKLNKHIDDYYEVQLIEVDVKQAKSVRRKLRTIITATKIKKLDDLTVGQVNVAIKKLRKHSSKKLKVGEAPREMPPLSLRSRNMYRAAVKSFINWMLTERRINFNPVFGLKDEDEQLEVKHPRTALTDEQFILLYQTAKGSTKTIEGIDGITRARAYLLSVVTGLRKRELASLTRKSFKFDKGNPRLEVMPTYSKNRKLAEVKLPHYVLNELRKWLTSVKVNEPLIPKLAVKKAYKIIRKDLEAAGISYQDEEGRFRDWHSLRHTFITRAWQSGAKAPVVQKLARHQDIRQTMGYSHMTNAEEREAVDKVPQLRLGPNRAEGVA